MINFFRKIRNKLLTENKFGKYIFYAIGEILLVVIGILIALQINTWNQNQLKEQKEQTLLNQLHKDFEFNDSIIKQGFSKYQRLRKFNKAIIRNTGPNVTIPADVIILDSLSFLVYPKIDLVYGSLNFSSQQMEIISNDQLKLAISKYPSLFYSYKEVENEVKNLTLNQRKIHQKYVSLLDSYPDLKQEKFKSDILGWLRDREFQNLTIDKDFMSRNAKGELDKLNKQNQMVLDLIKKDLNSHRFFD